MDAALPANISSELKISVTKNTVTLQYDLVTCIINGNRLENVIEQTLLLHSFAVVMAMCDWNKYVWLTF